MVRSLEIDLEYFRPKLKDRNYAKALYAALCNNEFEKDGKKWSCTWRYAGGLVADLRNEGEDYLDYYCSGLLHDEEPIAEGHITDELRQDIESLGWSIVGHS